MNRRRVKADAPEMPLIFLSILSNFPVAARRRRLSDAEYTSLAERNLKHEVFTIIRNVDAAIGRTSRCERRVHGIDRDGTVTPAAVWISAIREEVRLEQRRISATPSMASVADAEIEALLACTGAALPA